MEALALTTKPFAVMKVVSEGGENLTINVTSGAVEVTDESGESRKITLNDGYIYIKFDLILFR